jgi:glycosidase
MPASLFESSFQSVIETAKTASGQLNGPFHSPEDWRDMPIYFLMVDRFNNPGRTPAQPPFDNPQFCGFQGGNFTGVKEQLSYIKRLGMGAIWLSPVLKNLPFRDTYHGYGIHDFLRAEPRFADNPANADNELRALVDAAHAEGLHVILDIVLNHTGDVFAYQCEPNDGTCQITGGSESAFHTYTEPVSWRDPDGITRHGAEPVENLPDPSPEALVWPAELQKNEFFRRQGGTTNGGTVGDFCSLKQLRTEDSGVQNYLIRAFQYVIARYDIDGFRVDTLRYLKGDLPRLFGNSMREFALSIGKKNFFTFGEVLAPAAEDVIAGFIGRSTHDGDDRVGIDAALDYPLFFSLKSTIKGFGAPLSVAGMYQHRKTVERHILSSHGDATRFFVTFLDNHDMKERLRFVQPGNEHQFDDQVTLAIACLYSLPGIPCLYYGTEQGLHGSGNDEAVRECLWAGPGFNASSPLYLAIRAIGKVRASQPALRYGRFYFRPVSGDGETFGISPYQQGVLAFSRILNDEEVLTVANTNTNQSQSLDVIVDSTLNKPGTRRKLLYSNKSTPFPPDPVKSTGMATVYEADGSIGHGPLHTVRVTLQPMEVQILGH